MELIPELEVGWLNGWILICLLYLMYGFLLLVFPKDVVARLYDKSGRTKRQKAIIHAGGLLASVLFILLTFTPLKIGSNVFILGIAIYALGLTGFIVALMNFKNTPHDQPATRGL
jgi:fatty acid desaturase